MKTTSGQNRRIHQLLNQTKETAWKQDYVLEITNYRTGHSSEMTVDEANVLISILTDVKNKTVAGKSPYNQQVKDIDFFGKPLSSYGPAPDKMPVHPSEETEAEKCNRLRRAILRCCHDMGWYQRNTLTNTLRLNAQQKPMLDYARIDAWCQKHSKAKKKLNEHSSKELAGNGGLVWQFEQMAKNYGQKPA